jgi:hypothetical protein
MGLLRDGPPTIFIELVKNEFGIDTFIETGTYKARTSLWASEIFKNVITIEASKIIYNDNLRKYQDNHNISFLFGNSKDKLPGVITQLKQPAIFWLDAHFCGGMTFSENNKCPLLDEIHIINQSSNENVILIDDARFFLSPHSKFNKLDDWPNIIEILDLLNQVDDRYIIINEDVIFAVPKKMESLPADFAFNNNMKYFSKSKILDYIKKILKRAAMKL